MINSKNIQFILICFLIPLSAFSQRPDELLDEVKNSFPDEKAAFLEKKEEINITLNNGTIDVTADNYLEKIMLHPNAQVYADHSIHYNNTFTSIASIDAQVYQPNQKRYHKEKVDDIQTKSRLSGSIFYDDDKYKQIRFPKIQVGTRAVVSYTEKTKDPHFLGGFYFKSYIPIMKATYSVTFPKEVKLNYKVFNDPNNEIAFKESTRWGKTTYTWEATNMPSFRNPENAPAISYYEPHVAIYIGHYTENDETHTILSGVHDLFEWYDSMVENINKEKDEDLQQIVDSLISGKDEKREIVRAIFYWVQDNIKYVAFEDGLGGFVPREATEVCNKRYGDCKDMSSLLNEMLEYAGIESYLTWIGSRDIPYRYEELPTPMVDNHMIASVLLGGRYVFLDATGAHVPLGMPTDFIQGKEALIRKQSGEYHIETVPPVAAAENMYYDSSYVQLNNQSLTASAIATYDGLYKYDVIHKLMDKSVEKQKSVLKKSMEKGHNKFLIDRFTFNGLKDRDSSLTIKYDYTLDDYTSIADDDIYINMNLDRSYSDQKVNIEQREGISREIDYQSSETHVNALEIPKGYHADYVPEDTSFEHPEFNFSITYTKKDNLIIQRKTILVDTLMLRSNVFETWNGMIEQLNEAYNEVIVLTKSK